MQNALQIRTVSAALILTMRVGVVTAETQMPAPPQTVSFDAISIRPNATGGIVMIGNQRGGRFVASNVSVIMLFPMAFRPMQDNQILGGPDWLRTERFDIQARSDNVLTPQQSDAALRALLENRFQLRFHRETRERPIYQIVIAKNGVKLNSVDSSSTTGAPGTSPPSQTFPPGAVSSGPGRVEASAISMAQLAGVLSAILGRPVIDMTGLLGTFAVKLSFAVGGGPPLPKTGGAANQVGPIVRGVTPAETPPSIFTAVTEQLGLKLESSKGPVETVIIDNIERPSEN